MADRSGAHDTGNRLGGGGSLAAQHLLGEGFEVADAAGAWQPATAAIKGDTVEVQAAGVPEPAGVRYAWYGFPAVTLYNKEGLPATPFRHPAVDLAAMQEGKQK